MQLFQHDPLLYVKSFKQRKTGTWEGKPVLLHGGTTRSGLRKYLQVMPRASFVRGTKAGPPNRHEEDRETQH